MIGSGFFAVIAGVWAAAMTAIAAIALFFS